MSIPKKESRTKAEIEAASNRKREKEIEKDIRKIDEVLNKSDNSEMLNLHKYIDSKYHASIIEWGYGMYGFIDGKGFIYEDLDIDAIKENLVSMKPKLEAFIYGMNSKKNTDHIRNSDVNLIINNTVNISISFEETRQKIEDMTALNREQTDEILEKINELEEISKENSSRKTKWEKVKPIIAFAIDKGADVAIAILSLIMQMKLGG